MNRCRALILIVAIVATSCARNGDPAAKPNPPAATTKPVAAPVAIAPASASIELPAYKRVVLDNGLTLLLIEQREVPVLDVHVIVGASHALDPKGKQGAAWLVAQLLTKGTATRSAEQVAEELDFLGGTVEFNLGEDYTA